MHFTRTRLLCLLVTALVGSSLVSCRAEQHNGAIRSPEGVPSPQTIGLPTQFTVTRVAHFDEAASLVGYPILSSSAFDLVWGHSFVQPGLDHGDDVPRKVTSIYDVRGSAIYVTFAPRSFWPVGVLEEGQTVTLGAQDGWLSTRGEHRLVFNAFHVDTDRFGPVFMQVEGPVDSQEQMTALVSSFTVVSGSESGE